MNKKFKSRTHICFLIYLILCSIGVYECCYKWVFWVVTSEQSCQSKKLTNISQVQNIHVYSMLISLVNTSLFCDSWVGWAVEYTDCIHHQQVSWIYDTKLYLIVRLGALGNVEYSFIAITPWSTLTQVVVPIRIPSVGQIELFDY